ncbi:ABC transporter ATP-binding protein [Galbitalea soli]|uniref:ABC transporter ATP-binding protein n=1 Tax=Galbitalea soli TaxID=1268042 RepID=A0A7C9TPP6_9MICO|nr:ABC transporter ATP-binding protein [Galbitalea soli]NEM90675.1 ABC transporter ATP-binding protein [Galbitalea soli]NYJ31393.1 ABC-2 type transport system ATP-binding protein [Galbitalea soli]
MTSSDAAIETTTLRVRRGGVEVLHGVELRVPPGQLVGLLGPSGSGKSTLMRAIVGAQRIDGGEVRVLGERAGSPALRRRVGYVTQAPSVYDDLTVAQNLAYFARILGAPRSDVARVLDEVDLAPLAGRLVSRLSGGQLTRVSLGIALLGSPRLLVLDEPTVGLDPVLRRDLWRLFARLAASGVSLLVSSHVMDEARRCDRIVLLYQGSVLADLTPEELLRSTGTTDADDAFLALVAGAGR